MAQDTKNASLLDNIDQLGGFLAGRQMHLDPNQAGTEEYLQVERLSQMLHKVRGGLSVSGRDESAVTLSNVLSESTVLSPYIQPEGTKFQRGRISDDTIVLSRTLKETKVPNTLFTEIADYVEKTGLDPEAARIARQMDITAQGGSFIAQAIKPVSSRENTDTHLPLAAEALNL